MYNKVDLNGDKKPEVIVYAYGPMLGGSRGGATPGQAVLKFNGKKYPSNPSTQPMLGKDAKIKGVKILADEFVPNVGIPLE